MTTIMLLNIPLAVLFVGLVAGIPLWHVLKHPERGPRTADAVPVASVHHLPAYYDDGAYRRAA